MSLNVCIRRLGTPSHTLVQDLTLNVLPGQTLTLMGPSGSGKSSVLAAIAGTLHSTPHTGGEQLGFDGSVHLNGRELTRLPTAQRGIGLLFQDDLLFAHMSVAQNLLFAVPAGPREQRLAQVEQALQDAGLPGCGPRDPATLSGGQRARVALMRALLARPQALLLDEPFSRLDATLRAQFRAWLIAQLQARQIPAILVTHDAGDVADPQHLVQLSHV